MRSNISTQPEHHHILILRSNLGHEFWGKLLLVWYLPKPNILKSSTKTKHINRILCDLQWQVSAAPSLQAALNAELKPNDLSSEASLPLQSAADIILHCTSIL